MRARRPALDHRLEEAITRARRAAGASGKLGSRGGSLAQPPPSNGAVSNRNGRGGSGSNGAQGDTPEQAAAGGELRMHPAGQLEQHALERHAQAPTPMRTPQLRGDGQGNRRTLAGDTPARSRRPLEGSQSLGGGAGVSWCGGVRDDPQSGARTLSTCTEPRNVHGITTDCKPDLTGISRPASSPPSFGVPPQMGDCLLYTSPSPRD